MLAKPDLKGCKDFARTNSLEFFDSNSNFIRGQFYEHQGKPFKLGQAYEAKVYVFKNQDSKRERLIKDEQVVSNRSYVGFVSKRGDAYLIDRVFSGEIKSVNLDPKRSFNDFFGLPITELLNIAAENGTAIESTDKVVVELKKIPGFLWKGDKVERAKLTFARNGADWLPRKCEMYFSAKEPGKP